MIYHNINPSLNTNFEENVPQQEGIISEYYERLGKEYPQKYPELQTKIDDEKMVQRF